jgi:hypothetical protein
MKKKKKHNVSNILFAGALIVGILTFGALFAEEYAKQHCPILSSATMMGCPNLSWNCANNTTANVTTTQIMIPESTDKVYTFEKIANEIGQVPYSNEADSNGRTNINCVWHSNELIKRLNAAGYKAYEKTVNHEEHMIVRLQVYIEANDGHIIEPEEYASYGLEGI